MVIFLLGYIGVFIFSILDARKGSLYSFFEIEVPTFKTFNFDIGINNTYMENEEFLMRRVQLGFGIISFNFFFGTKLES